MDKKQTTLNFMTLGFGGGWEMVSKYDAVKSIRSKAVKELAMAISVGGVGNSMVLPALGYFEHYGQSGKLGPNTTFEIHIFLCQHKKC